MGGNRNYELRTYRGIDEACEYVRKIWTFQSHILTNTLTHIQLIPAKLGIILANIISVVTTHVVRL